MIDICFKIFLTQGRVLTEEALQHGGFVYEDLFSPAGNCEGAITISEEQHREIELEDELPALVRNLCFQANGELQRSGRGIYYFSSWAGQVMLSREGDLVKVEGAEVGSASFDPEALTAGLRDCGARFIDMLRKIHCREEAREPERLDLIAFLEEAKKELEAFKE
jgi:hypothetical protein